MFIIITLLLLYSSINRVGGLSTDLGPNRLISILLNGYIYNGNDKKSENHSKSFKGTRLTLMNI